ncbi:hypothetical protein NicSoilC12_15770 [Arthrobacter sp. NicSoilC12]|nr:hypothetical protein NicSoilC12_15770 [Arthrobacter sp. NicSoilC12]
MTALATENFREELLSRRYEPNVAPVNELLDVLQATKAGTAVPYVDPMHDVDECRIISLYSNIGTADASGFITAGDDEAATRMLGIQWKTRPAPRIRHALERPPVARPRRAERQVHTGPDFRGPEAAAEVPGPRFPAPP